MGSKSKSKVAAPVAAVPEKVKNGRVSKASETPKSAPVTKVSTKSPNVNGSAKTNGSASKSSKHSKKEESEDDDDDDEDDDSEDDDEDDEEDSDNDDDSEVEAAPILKGAAKIATTVKQAAEKTLSDAKKAVLGATEDDDEDDEDDDEDSEDDDDEESDSDDDEEETAQASVAKATKAAASSVSKAASAVADKTAKVVAKATEDDDDEDDDDEDEDDDDEDDSDDDDDDDEAEAKPAPMAAQASAGKRKADDVEEPAAKKAKTAGGDGVKNLFVGNLSWNVDEEWLAREFSEFGEVVSARIMTDRDSGRSKGFGYVEFTNAEDAAKALEGKKGTDLDNRTLNVDFATPRDNSSSAPRPQRANDRANKFGDSQSSPSDTLFVGNISFSATAEGIQEMFGEYGSITRVSLPTDPDSGALKGFGYVGFSSVDEARAALEALNGADVAGRAVRLDFATARTEGGGGRGGGFRGGRGGDRGGFRGGRGGDRGRGGRGGGFSRGGRGGGDRGGRGGRGGFSTNRGGVGDFSGKKMTF